MKIRCVGHACLEIEAAGMRFVTDPWWAGPAYTNQWYPWPEPQPAGLEERPIDYVYLSHGHEDHLHVDTLRALRPGATALVPHALTGGMADYLRAELGFQEVVELPHGEPVSLRNGAKATAYVNLTDSMLVLEADGRVLLDGNDALHSSPPAVIEHFCRLLRKNHPRIDTLFLGYGGASWFPNCVRLPGKDDRAVAQEREQLFIDNFLRVVERLAPRLACAFAGSFVLLEPHNRWINEVKLDLPGPDVQFARRGGPPQTRCHLLLPGDRIEGIEVVPGGCVRPNRLLLERAYATTLSAGCRRVESLKPLPEAAVKELVRRLDEQVRKNRRRPGWPLSLQVELRLRDNPGVAVRIDASADSAKAAPGRAPAGAPILELRSEIVETALAQDYGIEALVIGYGALVTLRRSADFAQIQRLLALLTPREESWRGLLRDARQSPRRVLDAAWRQRWPLAAYVGTRLGVLPHSYELKRLGARDAA